MNALTSYHRITHTDDEQNFQLKINKSRNKFSMIYLMQESRRGK